MADYSMQLNHYLSKLPDKYAVRLLRLFVGQLILSQRDFHKDVLRAAQLAIDIAESVKSPNQLAKLHKEASGLLGNNSSWGSDYRLNTEERRIKDRHRLISNLTARGFVEVFGALFKAEHYYRDLHRDELTPVYPEGYNQEHFYDSDDHIYVAANKRVMEIFRTSSWNQLSHAMIECFCPYTPPAIPQATIFNNNVRKLAEACYQGQAVPLCDAILDTGASEELAKHFAPGRAHPKGCQALEILLRKKP